MDLANKSALITGASRGIGRAIALEYASLGCNVAVNYVGNEAENAVDADQVVQECGKLGARALSVEASVTDYDACQRMVDEVIKTFGRIDIVVSNAGILRDRTLRKMTAEDWDAVVGVNLTGAFNVMKHVFPLMIEQRYGRVLCLSSVIGQAGGFGQTNYAAAKAGLIGFTKSLAREGAAKGVTANAIAPGLVDTTILRDVPADVMEGMLRQIPMGRLAQPEEIAKLAAFLSSDDAAYITGQVIGINGGFYI